MSEKQNEKTSNFFKYVSNPRSYTIRKWTMELIKERYTRQHDEVIERIASSLQTDKDVEDFGNLLATIYETAYINAVEEYKGQVEKLGVKVTVGKKDNG